MENRPITDENRQDAGEKYPNRYKPGQSGNPAGRPKKTKEEEDMLAELKALAPLAVQKMKTILESDRVAALARVRVIEIILERTFGKVESSVKVTNTQESIEAAEAELEAIFSSVEGECDGGLEGGVVH